MQILQRPTLWSMTAFFFTTNLAALMDDETDLMN